MLIDSYYARNKCADNAALIFVIVFVMFWYFVTIFGTLCSLSGDIESFECLIGENVNSFFTGMVLVVWK